VLLNKEADRTLSHSPLTTTQSLRVLSAIE